MAKYLVETYYTCTFKVNHYLDDINEAELKNLEKRDDGKFEVLDVKLDNRKTKSLDPKNNKVLENKKVEFVDQTNNQSPIKKDKLITNINLTKNEKKISNIVGKDLKKMNIFFAGIDFIDQKLNGDINITSPTGLKTYYDLSKINLAKTFWKELKA